MAHRADAIYPATVVGKPRQEDFFIGDLLQELLSPLFPLVMPAVEQLWSYGETGYHSLGAAVVKQRYAREAMASAFRILGEGQLSLTKFLLVTDRARGPARLPGDARARAGAHAVRDRPLRVLEPARWTRSTTPGRPSTLGSKGVWLGLGDPVRELPRQFSRGRGRRSDVRDVRVFCARLPGGGSAPAWTGRAASAAARLAARSGVCRAGRSWS